MATPPETPTASDATTLPEILRAIRQREGGRPQFTFVDRAGAILEQLDAGALLRRSGYVAQQLRAAGHTPGDRVLLAYPPDAAGFVTGVWGTILAGCVPVPVSVPDPRGGGAAMQTFRHIAADCGARTALTDRKVQAMMTLLQGKDRVASLVGRGEAGPALTWRALSGSVGEPEVDALLEAALRHTTADDVAFLQYTSGSTSEPRGVLVRHHNVLHNLRAMASATEVTDRSVLVGWVPMYHDLGLTGALFNAAFTGAHLVFFSPFAFLHNPELWFDLVERFGGTHIAAPDFGYRYLLKHATPGKQWRLGTLVTALQGGEPMRPDTVRQMVDRFAASGLEPGHFCNCLGMAESVLFVSGTPRLDGATLRIARRPFEREGVVVPADDVDALELVACGVPERAHGIDVIAVDPETRVALGADRVGELWVHSPSACDGYWGRTADENRERFRAELAGDRGLPIDGRTFLRTGDLGFVHDGRVFVCGRRKDMLILAGRNIYPQDLEVTIHEADPAIRRGCVAVVGLPGDPDERIGALVELKAPPKDPLAVVQHIQAALAAHHRLGAHAIVLLHKDSLLKTSSGKLRRSKCRDTWLAGGFAAASYFEMGVPARAPAEGLRGSVSWLTQLGGLFGRRPDAREAAPIAAPPRDLSPAEQRCEQLRGIAAAQMGLAPEDIDVDQPLVEQGFDSVRLLSFTEAAGGLLDLDIHPNAAMLHPTIRALATHLLPSDPAPARTGLLATGLLAPLRATGSEPPLVLLPPVGGHALWCMDLARELRASLPVWAFVAPEHVDGHPSPETVNGLVRAYVAELLHTLPDTPVFRIGGYSLGSTLALETALQLVEAGRAVEGVVLLGGALVEATDEPRDAAAVSVEVARQLGVPAAMMGEFEKLGFEGVMQLFAQQTRAVSPGAPEDLGRRMTAAATGSIDRAMRWTPRAVRVPVALLRTDQGDAPAASDPDWARLAEGPFEVVIVPGDHASMIRKPHAEALARHVEGVLDGWGRRGR